MASMIEIGVAHCWIFTLDIHTANFIWITIRRSDLMHDLYHGIARFLIKRHTPEFFKPSMRFWIINSLIVREHHRNQTCITRTLHVILTTQWMQP